MKTIKILIILFTTNIVFSQENLDSIAQFKISYLDSIKKTFRTFILRNLNYSEALVLISLLVGFVHCSFKCSRTFVYKSN